MTNLASGAGQQAVSARIDTFNADISLGDTRVHIHALTLDALVRTVAQLRPTEPVAAPAAPAAGKPKADAPKEAAASSSASAKGSEPAAQPSAAPAAEPSAAKPPADASAKPAEGEGFKYETLRANVHKLAGVDAAKCVEINKRFGVKSMKELPEAKWAEANAAVLEALAALQPA